MSKCDMTEREMLELLKLSAIAYTGGHFFGFDTKGNALIDPVVYSPFNPLENNGDAMSLAAALSMRVDFCSKTGCAARYGVDCENVIYVLFDSSRDLLKASRLAITKAAAEIGKSMA